MKKKLFQLHQTKCIFENSQVSKNANKISVLINTNIYFYNIMSILKLTQM